MAASQVFDSNGSAQVFVTVGHATDKKSPVRCTAGRRRDQLRPAPTGVPQDAHVSSSSSGM